VTSAGLEAADLAASAGLVLDEWQADILHGALGERRDDRWAAFEVAVIMPRQNGKGVLLEARELAGLFLFGEELILHSAHEFKTAAEAFRRVLSLIQSTPDLDRRVAKVRTSHGDEGVELKGGQRLRFVARSTGSGRGFSGDCVILDEAYNLSPDAMAALLPTMSARPNPQLWYTSSAPLVSSDVLRTLCKRGREGRSASLAYFEFCAEPMAAHHDRQAWVDANPALGIRISEEFIARELEALGEVEFARERLGIWPEDGVETVFPLAAWAACAIDPPEPPPRPVFFLDASPGLGSASIGVAAVYDGKPHLELADYRPGTDWLVARAAELASRHQGARFAALASGAVSALLPALRDVGVEPQEFTGPDMGRACGHLQKLIADRGMTHSGDPLFAEALAVAVKRDIGDDLWTWSRRKSGDISPLVAVTGAAWLLETQPSYDLMDSVW